MPPSFVATIFWRMPSGAIGFVRDVTTSVFLLGYVPIVPLVDLLFPLWDDKRQTLTDKIMSTVVVRAK